MIARANDSFRGASMIGTGRGAGQQPAASGANAIDRRPW